MSLGKESNRAGVGQVPGKGLECWAYPDSELLWNCWGWVTRERQEEPDQEGLSVPIRGWALP